MLLSLIIKEIIIIIIIIIQKMQANTNLVKGTSKEIEHMCLVHKLLCKRFMELHNFMIMESRIFIQVLVGTYGFR